MSGRQWTETVDHFALGCILAELDTSRPLFACRLVRGPTPAADLAKDLLEMDRVIGPLPFEMGRRIEELEPGGLQRKCEQPSVRGETRPRLPGHRVPTLKVRHPTSMTHVTDQNGQDRISERELYKVIKKLTNPNHRLRGSLKALAKRSCFAMD